MVEHQLPKLRVASSILVTRSSKITLLLLAGFSHLIYGLVITNGYSIISFSRSMLHDYISGRIIGQYVEIWQSRRLFLVE